MQLCIIYLISSVTLRMFLLVLVVTVDMGDQAEQCG